MNWKSLAEKLASRKFLSLVAVFITSLCVILQVDSSTSEHIIVCISTAIIAFAYIKTEGDLDMKALKKKDKEDVK